MTSSARAARFRLPAPPLQTLRARLVFGVLVALGGAAVITGLVRGSATWYVEGLVAASLGIVGLVCTTTDRWWAVVVGALGRLLSSCRSAPRRRYEGRGSSMAG